MKRKEVIQHYVRKLITSGYVPLPPKNAPEMKGRYEVCGQELKLKDYIKLERNSGYDHTVTDEFWTTGHSVYTKPCESFVLFRWN